MQILAIHILPGDAHMKRSSWIKVTLFAVPALLIGGVAVAEKSKPRTTQDSPDDSD